MTVRRLRASTMLLVRTSSTHTTWTPYVNNATCEDLVDSYHCRCKQGFTGPRCESAIDSCSSSPCQYGAACQYLSACTCPDVLLVCSTDDEVCQRAECLRRGEPDCRVRERSFSCDCNGTGFAGDVCDEDVDECAVQGGQCQHGGRCDNTVGSYSCDCSMTAFTGSRCHLDLDECSVDGLQVCRNNGQYRAKYNTAHTPEGPPL